MNLASRDIRHNFGRFVLTTIGLGTLLMIVMGMGGIYRGLVQDATLLVDRIDADLWVVQKDTRGPFAEISRVPANLEDRVRAVPGVLISHGFVSTTVQRERGGRPLRITVQGLSWPDDRGLWLPIVAGRALGRAHYEMIADESLKLPIGEKLKLGKDTYTVVGHTRAMTSPSGDSMAFFTLHDAQAIQFDLSGEAIRLERSARYGRAEQIEIGRTQPQVIERTLGPSSNLPALGPPVISAVVVKVKPGTDPAQVQSVIARWPDVTVHSFEGQRQLLLGGIVDRSRRQLGLFRVLLIIVSAIIMALILYTLTLDKLHDVAMLKLMGAKNRVILGLILQQAIVLGILAYGVAYLIGQWAFPLFPRRVILVPGDLWLLAGVVAGISIVASMLGIAGVERGTERGLVMKAGAHSGEIVLQAERLTKIYGSGHTEVVAVRDATLSVARGEVVALLGPSGAGKTTLLTLLGLILLPNAGRIMIGGTLVFEGHRLRGNARRFRRQHLGFVFQKANLIPFLTAAENVRLAMEINDEPARASRRRAMELLEYLGVGEQADRLPSRLSGGEQQRVAVARALANRPDLILADEPTAALDSVRGRQVMELFRKVAHEQDAGVIVVTHDHRALEVFDRTIEMEDGNLFQRAST